jgi:hypothetical protein
MARRSKYNVRLDDLGKLARTVDGVVPSDDCGLVRVVLPWALGLAPRPKGLPCRDGFFCL